MQAPGNDTNVLYDDFGFAPLGGTRLPRQSASARENTPAAIRASFITLHDGTRLHCLEAGTLSTDPTLVLIPGWTLPAFLWNEQLK